MGYTGIKQATIAYHVSRDGQPVDVNGVPIAISGNRQAIALIEGFPNPNEALYEVAKYFAPNAAVDGTPTTVYDPQSCPVGDEPDWILSTDAWDMDGHWYDSETWT